MAKDRSSKRGSKSSKLLKKAKELVQEQLQSSKTDKGMARGPVDEELRQNVRDLGGDDEDLELLEGVDSEDEITGGSSRIDPAAEKALKKELGAFMKGLDFGKLRPADAVQDQAVGNEESDEDEEEDEDEERASEGEDEEREEDEDEDDDEDEDARDDAEVSDELATSPNLPKPQLPPTTSSGLVDRDPKSGSNLPAAPMWSQLLPTLPSMPTPAPFVSPSKISNLKARGTQLLDSLPPLSRSGSSSDAAFISQILSSGTHSDKLSALILLVRESPIHAVKELGRLRNMTGWKEGDLGGASGGGNKGQRVAAIKALADWWISGGGKKDGKLKYFADQPLLAHPNVTDRHLVVWAFEDFLKRWFFNLLQVLEVLSHDVLPFVRTQAIYITFQLLSGNAEQEQNLMRLGVNKLGDNDKSVASKTSHHLLQLLQVHPNMKSIVAREVSAIVLKPATQSSAPAASGSHTRFDDGAPKKAETSKSEGVPHGRYYGLITLNQLSLAKADQEVAGKLVSLYFEVFREVLGESMKQDKAAAAAGDGEEGEEEKVDENATGKVERWRGRKKGQKQKDGRKTALENEEATVETGEAKMIAAVLTGIHRALPYAKLDDALFNGYMDTLFRITHAGTFNTSIAALQLIFQVCLARDDVSDRFYRTIYDSLFDGRLFTSSKQAMYLNLLFKAMKADTTTSRVMAFVKRLLQMLGMHQPPFICGALYLLGELFSTTPGLRRMLVEPEDDDVEYFVDAGTDKQAPTAGSSRNTYDGKKREPQYAHADSSCLWELLPFLDHFHPSVSLQAAQLLEGVPISGSSDISLNTLVSFLDRFVYRNPKKNVSQKGASVMQPGSSDGTMLVQQKGARSAAGVVNSEEFWRKKIEEVPADQLFFHKFFASKLTQKSASKKSKNDDEDVDLSDEDGDVSIGDVDDDDEEEDEAVAAAEDESDAEDEDVDEEVEVEDVDGEDKDEDAEAEEEDSDPEEAEIWKAMLASMPDDDDEFDISDDSDSEEGESEYDMVEGGEEAWGGIQDGGDADDTDDTDDDEGEEEDGDDGDDSDFPDLQDEDDDLIPMDEVPDIVLDASASEEEEEEPAGKKRKRGDERKERKKKRKEMPTFGSYEDYAAMIEAAGNDGED